jgi:tRNA pseudouridine38-40 synthase
VKYAAKLSYDGSAFCGWQKQKGIAGATIQDTFESALAILDGGHVPVTVAGRTDKGVHAAGQVASFSMSRYWEPEKLRNALDANLPESVAVMSVSGVPENFSARRSALWREYIYFVWKEHGCPPHIRPYVWKNTVPWDHGRIREACSIIEGEHDFSAFCRLGDCPENSIRTVIRANFSSRGSLYRVRVRGKSFLTNMIRIILGSIDLVGTGKKDIPWLESLLQGKSREEAGPTAPARGLFLWKVGYEYSSLDRS